MPSYMITGAVTFTISARIDSAEDEFDAIKKFKENVDGRKWSINQYAPESVDVFDVEEEGDFNNQSTQKVSFKENE